MGKGGTRSVHEEMLVAGATMHVLAVWAGHPRPGYWDVERAVEVFFQGPGRM